MRGGRGRVAGIAAAALAAGIGGIVGGTDAAAAGDVVSVMGRTASPRIGQAAAGDRRAGASAGAGAGGVPADAVIRNAAHGDWVLYCQGCHEARAQGSAIGRIPRLAGSVGYFLQVPGGREYLVQVPGVNNTGLDDRRIAAVVNYVIDAFAGESRPADFRPYTEAEVARHRADRPVDIALRRRQMLQRREQAGLPPP